MVTVKVDTRDFSFNVIQNTELSRIHYIFVSEITYYISSEMLSVQLKFSVRVGVIRGWWRLGFRVRL